MNRIIKALFLPIIATIFVGCKPLDQLNQHSFVLTVVPINAIGDEQVKVVAGVVCDGASSVNLILDHKSTIAPTAVFIEADAKFGTFITGPSNYDRTAITYTAPDVFPGEAGQSVVNFPITIRVSVGSDHVFYNTELKLLRTPVLLAHGFNSGAVTFDPLRANLLQSGNYTDLSLYALDYSATSLDSYETNKTVISAGIDSLRKRHIRSGYVANKVDIVGHSMGGVLTRIYLQNPGYRYDIFRLITIDTPHSGTQLADFGLELAANYPNTVLSQVALSGAIRDFKTDSPATQDLNGSKLNKVKVPTHVLSAAYGGDEHVAQLIKDKEYVSALLSYLVNGLTQQLIYNEDNDIVVPLSSQQAGLSGIHNTHYNDQWHSSVHTTPQSATDIANLLSKSTKGDNSPFAIGGLRPPTLTYNPQGLGVKFENFTESTPVASCTRGSKVTITFHAPQAVSSSLFIVTEQLPDGKEKTYHMDNHMTGVTRYVFDVPANAPNNLKFHFIGLWEGSQKGNVVFHSSSYNVSVN